MQTAGKVLVLLGVLLCTVQTGAAITSYDIAIDGDTARINVSFELYTDEDNKVNYWQTSWNMPDGAEVRHLEDSQGEIDGYTVQGNTIQFKTNEGKKRSKEVVDVALVVENIVEEEYNGVKLVTLQLSGFSDLRADVPDEKTQATVTSTEPIRSESHSWGFDYTLDEHEVAYSGDGPLNLYLAIGDGGTEYDNFVLYGEGNLSEADDMFGIVPAVTGFLPDLNRYPVVTLPDDVYDREVDAWSAGQYRTGGLIFLRESTLDKDKLPAVLMHEVMHGVNEHAVRWAGNDITWFDEGTAKYVEFLVKNEKGIRQPEIFGEETTWRGPCESSSRQCRYTLQPRGTPDQLWEYYRQNRSAMYTWSPRTSRSDAERTFGYAFSELLIRNYIRSNGFDALHPVYTKLRQVEERPDGPQAATQTVLDMMGADFRPCYREERDAFETCLNAANAMDPEVPDSVDVADETQSIDIQEIERPEPAPDVIDTIQNASARNGIGTAARTLATQLWLELQRLLTDITNNLFNQQ